MASWSKIHSAICKSLTVRKLEEENGTAALLWFHLLSAGRPWGRFWLAKIRPTVIPWWTWVSDEELEKCIEDLVVGGFAYIYEVDERQVLQISNWHDYNECRWEWQGAVEIPHPEDFTPPATLISACARKPELIARFGLGLTRTEGKPHRRAAPETPAAPEYASVVIREALLEACPAMQAGAVGKWVKALMEAVADANFGMNEQQVAAAIRSNPPSIADSIYKYREALLDRPSRRKARATGYAMPEEEAGDPLTQYPTDIEEEMRLDAEKILGKPGG